MNDFRTIKELRPFASQIFKHLDRFLGAYKFPSDHMKNEQLTSKKLKDMA